MGWVIHCDCGTPVRGTTDDELVANAQDHAKNKHGVIVTRDQALGLADATDRAYAKGCLVGQPVDGAVDGR